ncbi:molybdopterin-dependent oxidoreductase [Mycolicibacterium sp.]|uniref:molybdopterin-containing oxidoreductase family protein n=1 Tax=Mycolicibacterium sp. TaxID=2320850 RepID=UPI0028ADB3B4|nr:molybdopterin-dependent oxidoreductase [Mycolicibacterium sp.]
MTNEHETEFKTTYCRICEALCGMVAEVQDGRLVALRPDKDHPLSTGFACPKGIAFTEVVNDPDRVTTPLRRRPDGGFDQVSWDEAMTDIAQRLSDIHRRHGSKAVGWYFGNPGAFSYAHLMAVVLFVHGLGLGTHLFSASSQDTHSRIKASQLLYGIGSAIPIPDLSRTDLLVVMGANPVVSHGSILTAPRISDRMRDIVKRGGRVIVIDPRKTETAAQFEWLGIAPDTDALLLLSLLQVMFAEDLLDRQAIAIQATGLGWLATQCAQFTPERTEAATGIPAATVRDLARNLATNPRAAVYGRIGTCAGRFGTLTSYLLDAVNLVAGNIDVPGGSVFGSFGVPGETWAFTALGALLRYDNRRNRSRVGGFGNLIRTEPSTMMAGEITTPGDRQIRALFVSAGNPVLSVPNGAQLADAMQHLELSVGLDIYVTETTSRCDYVLPVTTMYERDDFPLLFQPFHATPFRQVTEAVVPPRGEVRTEWEIIDDLMRRMAGRSPIFAGLAVARASAGLLGRKLGPRQLADIFIRVGRRGDLFGLRRGGLSFRRLAERDPHGVVLEPELRTGVLGSAVAYPGRRMRLMHTEIAAQIEQLGGREEPVGYPLRLIGMRQARSENSWLHNAPLLMRGDRSPRALMHTDDAKQRGISEGDEVAVRSPFGKISLPARLTDDIVAGVVAIPHGWGHRGGGWRLANQVGGANVNDLTSNDPDDVESLSGMAWLTGVPIEVERT